MNVHELTLQNYTAASGCPSACQPILYLGTAGSYGNEQINVVLGEGWQSLTHRPSRLRNWLLTVPSTPTTTPPW